MPLYEFRIEDALDFSKRQGIPTFQRGNELHFKTCPYCHGGRNHDKNTFSINLTTGLFNCKRASCNAHGSMITLASDFDLSLGRDADEYYRIKPGHFRTIKKQLSEDDVTDTAITYLTGRSIPEEVVKRYRITSQKEHPDILVFPFYEPDGQRISFIKYRNTAPKEGQHKEWCEANCKPILFGRHGSVQHGRQNADHDGRPDRHSERRGSRVPELRIGANRKKWIHLGTALLGLAADIRPADHLRRP